MTKVDPKLLLLPTLVLAAASTASADGLRTTVNVKASDYPHDLAELRDIAEWSGASMCVDLRDNDPDCQIYHKAADYEFNDPDCRIMPYDVTLPPDPSQAEQDHYNDYLESVEDFWESVAKAKADNPSILIGTYLSGQRVQVRWRAYPASAIDRSVMVSNPNYSSEWFDEVFDAHDDAPDCDTQHPCSSGYTCISGSCLKNCTVDGDCTHVGEQCEPAQTVTGHACFLELEYDNVDIEIQAARNAFRDQIIAENQNRNQRATAWETAHPGHEVSLDILYLDNIVHPSSFSSPDATYRWIDRTTLLREVKAAVNNAGQKVIANVALNQAHLLHPGGDYEGDLQALWESVDGMTLEIPYHPNARADSQKTQDTIDVYRAFLDGDPTDPNDRKRLIFMALAPQADLPTQRTFLAGFAMCIYEPGDLLYVTGGANENWDSWATQYGDPLGDADLMDFPVIKREFEHANLEVNAQTRDVDWHEISDHLPTIVAAYDGEGEPTLGSDYRVDTTNMGTPERPNVVLSTPRQDWRIWSEDVDNDDDVGDIGSITVEPNKNFGVRLLRDDDGPGARDVMAINLDPQNEANSTNLLSANVTREVKGGITVKADDQNNGGVLENLTLTSVTGVIKARGASELFIHEMCGDLQIDGVTGDFYVGDYAGDLTIQSSSAVMQFLDVAGSLTIDSIESQGSLEISDDLVEGSTVTVGAAFGDITLVDIEGQVTIGSASGDIDVWEIGASELGAYLLVNDLWAGALNVDLVAEGAGLFVGEVGTAIDVSALRGRMDTFGDVSTSSVVTVSQMFAGSELNVTSDSSSPPEEMEGTIRLPNGVAEEAFVAVRAELVGQIDLVGQDMAGGMGLLGGGSGGLIYGGALTGYLSLGEGYPAGWDTTPAFQGTVDFETIAESGILATTACVDLESQILLTDGHNGLISISGDMSSSASITIVGISNGDIRLGLCEGTTDGRIEVVGEIVGSLDIPGIFGGQLCADGLQGDKPLPPNIHIPDIGPAATLCITEGGIPAVPCEADLVVPAVEPGDPVQNQKNRFISFVPGNSGQRMAIAVNLKSLQHPPTNPSGGNPPDLSMYEDKKVFYVNRLRDAQGNLNIVCRDGNLPPPNDRYYMCATLGCIPEYQDWGTLLGGDDVVLHVTSPEIVPSSLYNVHFLAEGCDEHNWAAFTPGVWLESRLYGNVDNDPRLNATDISKVVDKVKDLPSAIAERSALLRPAPITHSSSANATDIGEAVDAVKGQPYQQLSGPNGLRTCP